MPVKSQSSSSYLKERPKIPKTYSRAVSVHDVTVSSVTTMPGLRQSERACTSTNKNITLLHITVKMLVVGFYGQQLHLLHTRVTTATVTWQTSLTRKHSPFLLPSSWCDVTHKDITTSIHIQNLCTVQLKQKNNIRISTRFHTAFFKVCHWTRGLNYYYVLQSSRQKSQLWTHCSTAFFMVWRHRS